MGNDFAKLCNSTLGDVFVKFCFRISTLGVMSWCRSASAIPLWRYVFAKFCFRNSALFIYLCNHIFLYRVTQLAKITPRRGGGGTLIFSAYVGSDPASTVHPPKNIRNFKHPKKIFEILATPKNIPILYLDLKKRP